jgi:ribosomal protein S18 acetylase RimI-like enzyme
VVTGGRGAEQDLEIREFDEADQAAVVDLWDLVFPDDPSRNQPAVIIRRKVARQRELFLVGLFQGRLVGTVLGGYDGFRGWVYHLAVHPKHRRRGFGRRLMEGAEARLRALGCPKLNVQVRAHNPAVVGFYERLGYSVEDRVSMGKVLP